MRRFLVNIRTSKTSDHHFVALKLPIWATGILLLGVGPSRSVFYIIWLWLVLCSLQLFVFILCEMFTVTLRLFVHGRFPTLSLSSIQVMPFLDLVVSAITVSKNMHGVKLL